jgi:hypothetical protein
MFSLLVLYFLFFITSPPQHTHAYISYIFWPDPCMRGCTPNDRLRQCRFLRCPPPPPSRMQIHSGEVCLNSVQRLQRVRAFACLRIIYIVYISITIYMESRQVKENASRANKWTKSQKQVRNLLYSRIIFFPNFVSLTHTRVCDESTFLQKRFQNVFQCTFYLCN